MAFNSLLRFYFDHIDKISFSLFMKKSFLFKLSQLCTKFVIYLLFVLEKTIALLHVGLFLVSEVLTLLTESCLDLAKSGVFCL